MKLRRMIILAGAILLLVGAVSAVMSMLIPADPTTPSAARIVSISSAIGMALAGFGLLGISWQSDRSRLLARGAAIILGFLAGGGATVILLGAVQGNSTPASLDEFQRTGSFGTESDLVLLIAFLAAAVALAALTLTGRRRAGAALAGSLAVMVGLVGLGAVVCWILGIQPERADLSRALLNSSLFVILSVGLFAGAKAEFERLSAAQDTPVLDHRLSAATGTCLGLLALIGLVIFSLTAREAEHHRRLHDIERFREALHSIESKLQAAEHAATHALDLNEDSVFVPFNQAITEFGTTLRELNEFATWPSQREPLLRLLRLGKAEADQLQSALGIRQTRQPKAAAQTVALLDIGGTSTELGREILALKTSLERESRDIAWRQEDRRKKSTIVLLVAALTIALLLGAVHLFFERHSTARHRSETALRRHNETLKNFAHTVAHDLRAPLRGIAGYAAELDGQIQQVDKRGRHCITQINVAAQNLEKLIGDTLEYAQLDAETPQLKTIVLPTLIASLLQQRAPEIRQHGTKVDTHFAVVTVIGWERGLVQIIGNLLDNAIKYSRHAQPPRLRIETAQTPLSWRLVIYDNGVGFDMKYHDRIFGLFQRLVTTDEFEGTGAGLAIVRKITDRLGGSVCAEGRPGGGATFLVELPRISSSELT